MSDELYGTEQCTVSHLLRFCHYRIVTVVTSLSERFCFGHKTKTLAGIPEISLNTRGNQCRYTGNLIEHTGKAESVCRKSHWTHGESSSVYRKSRWTHGESRVGIPEISLNTRGKQFGIQEISLNTFGNESWYTGNLVEHRDFSSVRLPTHSKGRFRQDGMEDHVMP
jgi:hypothetical protein